MINWLEFVTYTSNIFIVFTLIVTFFYFFMFLLSFLSMNKQYKLNKNSYHHALTNIAYTKPFSVLIPAYNEEAGILQSVRSALSLQYPQLEVIVINDGSTDNTLQKVIEHFHMKPVPQAVQQLIYTKPVRNIYVSTLLPNLWLIDKENGGKADALNAGINLSHYSYFCSIDGDSILEKDSLIKVVKPIIDSDGDVIAAGGTVRIANSCVIKGGQINEVHLSKKPLVIYQVIEYLRAFLLGRMGLSLYNLTLIISGAFGVYSKEWVIKAGGYSVNVVGEDMELVVKLHKTIREHKVKKKIVFVSDPVCWTEAPEQLKYLGRQRSRWHRGLIESLWKHRKMTLNPKYGAIGMVSMPYYWIVEFFGPIIELCGYILLILCLIFGGIYYEFAILIFLAFLFYGSIVTLLAVLLDNWSMRRYLNISDVFRLYLYALTETVWYRPLTVLWRIKGVIQFLFGKSHWGEMKRKGL